MKTMQECKFCNKQFETNVVWYSPFNDEYFSTCDDCAHKHVNELNPHATITLE